MGRFYDGVAWFMTAWFNDIAFLGTVSIDCIGAGTLYRIAVYANIGCTCKHSKIIISLFKNHISFNILERSIMLRFSTIILMELCDCLREYK